MHTLALPNTIKTQKRIFLFVKREQNEIAGDVKCYMCEYICTHIYFFFSFRISSEDGGKRL